MLDNLLFVVFPYVAVALALGGTVYRYLTNQFSFTSLSSQFLESDVQFWGSTLWHYGILPTLAIHLAGFTLPKVMAAMHSTPETLYLAELTGKVLGIMALVGAVVLFYRAGCFGQDPRGYHTCGLGCSGFVNCPSGAWTDDRIYVSLGSNLVPAYGHPLGRFVGNLSARTTIRVCLAINTQTAFPERHSVDIAFSVYPPRAYGGIPCQLPLAKFPIGNLDTAQSQLGESHVE